MRRLLFLLLLSFPAAFTALTQPSRRQQSLTQRRRQLPEPRSAPPSARTRNPNGARRGSTRFANPKAASESNSYISRLSLLLFHRFLRERKQYTRGGLRCRRQLGGSPAHQFVPERNAQGMFVCVHVRHIWILKPAQLFFWYYPPTAKGNENDLIFW